MINKKYGHIIGDKVLFQFAFALEKLIPNGFAFHMNGTVFTLILPYVSQSEGDRNISKLLDFLESGIVCTNEHIRFRPWFSGLVSAGMLPEHRRILLYGSTHPSQRA